MSKYLPVANATTSFWLAPKDEFYTHRTTPDLPKEAGIVVIGSGYAGATTTYFLCEDNPTPPSIVMLEARNVCSGATGRNGGHLKPDLYRAHNSFVGKYGLKGAADIINFEHAHLAAMKELIEKEKIACDFVLTRSCDVHMTPSAASETVSNYNSMLKNPFVNCKSDLQISHGEEARVISKVEGSPVCVTYTAGQLWPYKLIKAILKICIERHGLNLQSNTPALETKKLSNGKWLVKTGRGDIVCDRLILATNAYTASIEPRFENKIVPIRGTVAHIDSADSKQRTPHLTNTYGIRFDGADSDYLINRPDGSVIVGGAKKHIFPFKDLFYNNVDDSTIVPESEKYFDTYMSDQFYTWKNFNSVVKRVWCGILGYSDDLLPYVGEFPDEKNKYIIAGFHGHGMPRVLLSAKALATSIKNDTNISGLPDSFKISQSRLDSKENVILKSTDTENLHKKVMKSKL